MLDVFKHNASGCLFYLILKLQRKATAACGRATRYALLYPGTLSSHGCTVGHPLHFRESAAQTWSLSPRGTSHHTVLETRRLLPLCARAGNVGGKRQECESRFVLDQGAGNHHCKGLGLRITTELGHQALAEPVLHCMKSKRRFAPDLLLACYLALWGERWFLCGSDVNTGMYLFL